MALSLVATWMLVAEPVAPAQFGQHGQCDAGHGAHAKAGETTVPSAPEGLSGSDWSSILAAYEAGRHQVEAVEGGHRAHNPGQRWTTLFDERGFTIAPNRGGWAWGLDLLGYGWGKAEQRVKVPACVHAVGQRVAYTWDARLTEWYANDERGLEHGYTVHTRPEETAGPLVLELAIRGGLLPIISVDARDVRFVGEEGAAMLTYTGLSVWDADGLALTAGWQRTEGGLRLLVEDQGARYPLIIDPLAQQAYLKASNSDPGDQFGSAVSVSGDTVVVGAPLEDSNATGVNGDQADNSATHSGAAYVFVRSGTSWSQQAYLKASNPDPGDRFGYSVSVSGDTIVVGARFEDSGAVGVNGSQTNSPGKSDSGAVYVFGRSGVNWSQQAYLKASNSEAHGEFGKSVSLSGDTVVVGSEWNSAAGAAYVFARSGTSWSQQAFLLASNWEQSDFFGGSVSVSGNTLVVGASFESSSATGVNGDQADNSASFAGAAYVFERTGTSWSQQAYLKASNAGAGDFFGESVSVFGNTLVVGARGEDSNATGVNGNQADNSAPWAGAVYVFERNGTSWGQQAYLKASNSGSYCFGCSVAVAGDTIVVGSGINAAYLFVRGGTSWSQHTCVNGANTESGDGFGGPVSVSGGTLVVGAPFEASNATGVNGNQADNSAGSSGAAYLFDLAAPSPDPWTNLLFALPGVAGDPLLLGSGPLTVGSSGTLLLSQAAPSALSILFISSASSPVPFSCGVLWPMPFAVALPLTTNGVGSRAVAWTNFPAGLSCLSLYFQCGIQDAAAVCGVALSNALRAHVP